MSDYFKVDAADGKITIAERVKKLKQISTTKLYNDLDHRFKFLSTLLFTSLQALDAGHARQGKFLNFELMLPILEQYLRVVAVNKPLPETECKRAKSMYETGASMEPDLYPNIQTVY